MSFLASDQWAPGWLRQTGRAAIALGLGVAVGLTAANPGLLLGVLAITATALVVASLRRPDPLVFLAFLVVATPRVPIPGSPLPAGEVLMLVAMASAWLTRGTEHRRIPSWFQLSCGALLAIFLGSSLINGLYSYSMIKRMIHMVVFVLTALVIARELIPTKVAARGTAFGLVISSLTGMIFISTSAYHGRLTGLFGDPNVAGFLLVVLGPIALSRIEGRLPRSLLGLFWLTALIMTFSRTSFLALLVFGVWFLVGKRVKRGQAIVLIGLLVIAIGVLPTQVQSIGPFGDRTGSDQLRNRVASQELKAIRKSPIWGNGAGTARVLVDQEQFKFYFHNSYFALVNEGGFLALIAYLPILGGVFLALIGLEREDRDTWLELSLIGVAVLGINLGEVLLELAAAIAIGFALAHVLTARHRRTIDDRVEVRA